MPPFPMKAPAAKRPPKEKGAIKRKRKPTRESYGMYLHKVLKQVHPDCAISTKGMKVMDAFIHDAFERIAVEAGKLVRREKKGTLSAREIQTATRLILSGELGRHAIAEGTKAMNKYTANT